MLQGEPGAERVEALLDGSVVSTVNWAEVIQKAQARGVDTEGLAEELSGAGLQVVPFDLADAERSGRLWADTWRHGLSLGDRACLARRWSATSRCSLRTTLGPNWTSE